MFNPETAPDEAARFLISRAASYPDQRTGAIYAIAYALLTPHRNTEVLQSLSPTFNAASGQEFMALFQGAPTPERRREQTAQRNWRPTSPP